MSRSPESVEELRSQVRALTAAIEARDRIIKGVTARPARRAAKSDERQAELIARHFPLTAFAMGPGRRIRLPETLRDIAEVIGREAAVRLAEGMRPITEEGKPASTGSRPRRLMIYVPRRLTPDHPLVGLLGWTIALKLQRSHTNLIIEIPLCADLMRAYRDHCIAEMARGGGDVGAVASWFQLHERSVRDILAKEGVEIAPEGKAAGHGNLAGE